MSKVKAPCTKCQFVKGLIFVALLVFVGSYGYRRLSTPSKQPVSELQMQIATVLPSPRLVHPFQLKDDQGRAFSEKNLKDKWSILFFGFTSCPMMCPTTMVELGKMYQVLQMEAIKELPQVVMVSIDPEHDTVAELHRYVKRFDPHFIGLTGDDKQIKHLTTELGIVYLRSGNSADKMPSTIDHSGTLVLINPKGEAIAFFSFPHEAKKIAEDYRSITEYDS